MKTFRQFLTEERMTREQALKILGLSSVPSSEELEKVYKALVRQYHPDRPGGNTEKMALVNAAHDVLEPKSGSGISSVKTYGSHESWDEYQRQKADHDEKAKVYRQIAADAFNQHFRMEPFTLHFEAVFGEPFIGEMTPHFEPRGMYGLYDSINAYVEWVNASRSIVLSTQIDVSFRELFEKPRLANAESALQVYAYSDILVNRRKVRLAEKRYRFDTSYRTLYDPSILFPADKLQKNSQSAQTRKLSKRDVYLSLEKELRARSSGDSVSIPIGEVRLLIYRIVFQRYPSWGVNGIYGERMGNRLDMGVTMFIAEDESHMNRFFDVIRDLQRTNAGIPEINQALTHLKAEFAAEAKH
jgi:DnaJ-like protein